MRNNMKVYVEYSSGETGIHKHKSFSALKNIYIAIAIEIL